MAGDCVYAFGYRGEGPDLREYLVCIDAATGKVRWERAFNDFLSDIIYNRYSIGSPTVDPQSGNIYLLTSPGLLLCSSPDGRTLWEHSLMEEFGRLAFPNGRTGSPVIAADLVIVRGITSNCGCQGPARDRFYAFNKRSGELVWSSTPGVRPRDSSFSTPVPAGDRIYQVTHTGALCAVDARSGRVLWRKKLAPDQLHASPLYADGKLYVPMRNGKFYILRPTDTGAEILSEQQLEGSCLGAPAVWQGRIYVQTTAKLYCFGAPDRAVPAVPASVDTSSPARPGPPTSLQIVPAEVLLRPGETQRFRVRRIDARGLVVDEVPSRSLQWSPYIPATAKVKSRMNAQVDAAGNLVADPRPVSHPAEAGVHFAYPPLPWIGARFKWEVRERDGSKVLAKTLDNVLFQRALTFLGHPDMHDYTIEADVMSDGNRRIMSTVGVINQRYFIALDGNWQQLRVISNPERVNQGVPFHWRPKTWYRLKSRADLRSDGSGTIRAKAWPRGEKEPEGWTIEVTHRHAHTHGSPGLYGFAPQSRMRVYVDSISVTANQKT